jgi:Uma2 family endonuclease
MSARIEPLLTVADLDACPDDGNRYELVAGELFVSRSPGISHQRVLHNLQLEFGLYLRQNPIGILVPGTGAVFSDYDAVIPDLVFVLNERWAEVVSGTRITRAPDLVVEIISPGSENRRRDLSVKRQLYAKYGVGEYWIVDPESRSVEIYRLTGSGLEKIATMIDSDKITSPLTPGFELSASALFNL